MRTLMGLLTPLINLGREQRAGLDARGLANMLLGQKYEPND